MKEQMTGLAAKSKTASHALALLSAQEKNTCLLAMADALESHKAAIQEANARDMVAGRQMGLSKAMLDRLELTDQRVEGMAKGLREVAALPDPVGRVLDERTRPNGLLLRKISTPIGVIMIIYESRPNVTADAASLCFKSGNATILRGGKEALNSNQIIARLMIEAGRKTLARFPEDAIQVVPTTDREAIPALLSLTDYVDLCMPRGGEGLIRAVTDCSKVPVIKHYKGVCHVFVDADADMKMAEEIAFNSKVQRPGVCNAMETLLVDRAVATQFLPRIAARLGEKEVQLRVDEAADSILRSDLPSCIPHLRRASEADWSTEYNDYILNVGVVDGVQGAVDHINRHGSAHTETVVTASEEHAHHFMAATDASTVYWNASTRFTDGAEFGMGAEIGISTDKVGARGPMGLEELTSYKWLGFGTGQIRT